MREAHGGTGLALYRRETLRNARLWYFRIRLRVAGVCGSFAATTASFIDPNEA